MEPADVIELIIDNRAMADGLGGVPAIHIARTGPGSLDIDYGDAGRFTLTVEASH